MFAMGIIGGIFGILASILALFIGGVGEAFGAEDASSVTGLGWGALLLSILGIIGASISKSKPKLAGALMLVSGIGGFICISLFYLISGILFIVAGFIGVFSKKKKNTAPPVSMQG